MHMQNIIFWMRSSYGDSRIYRRMHSSQYYADMAVAALALWRQLEVSCGETLFSPCGLLFFGRADTGETIEGRWARSVCLASGAHRLPTSESRHADRWHAVCQGCWQHCGEWSWSISTTVLQRSITSGLLAQALRRRECLRRAQGCCM